MTSKLKLTPIATAVASVMFLGLAAAPMAGAQNTGSQSGASTARSASEGKQQSAQSGKSQPSSMSYMRASRLMGKSIRNAQGQDLGQLDDMVVDITKNRIHYAIVERGGILGIGEKAIAVPISQFRIGAREGDLVLNMTEQQLKDSPGLERDVEWNDPRTWDNIGQYYHRTLGMPATGTDGRFQRASDVLGMDVLDRTGDEVGEIEDLVVNLSNGSIHYAVLEFDRAWNPNDKLVALPMSSLRPEARGNDLTINMTREQLANAPSFDTRQWPNMADSNFRNRVATFGRDTVGMDRGGTAAPTTVTTILIVDEPEFLRLDSDRDGRLSRGEVRAVSRLNQQWDKLDRNSDGYLSREEIDSNAAQGSASSGTSGTSGSQSSPGSGYGGQGSASSGEKR